MQQPNYTDNQFVNGALLNQGQSYIAASLKDLGASLFTAGLFYPNDLTYTLNSLSVSVSAGTSFRLLDGEGNLCGFYGTTNGQTSSSVTVDFSSLVPASGSVTAYLVATRYALSQNSTAVIGPPIGHPDYNPSNAPFLWYTETEDSLSVYATTTAPDNSSVFELLRTTLTAGQTSITSYSTANIKYAQPQQSVVPYAGNPNGKVAGVQGGNGISPTIVWDTNDNILWFCTTTGTASSAVWQGLAPLTGNSNYAFNVADATTSTEAVALQQLQNNTLAVNFTSGVFSNIQVFTSSGTFTVPAGVSKVKVTVVGGGGGGAGTNSGYGAGYNGGGNGGAGGAAIGVFSVTPGPAYTVTVGAGGAAGTGAAPPTNGGAGGTSSFGSLASATGGVEGSNTNGGNAGGTGGSGLGGTLNVSGGDGGDGQGDGIVFASVGGASLLGGGGRAANGVGYSGTVPGSGGGGAYGAANNGGAGANGIVIVEY